jgi:glycosyltransferase involved in cell wall biosynthesis
VSASSAADDGVLVDIGIPTYGRPNYLAEAIESVRRQTVSSWRLTISENGAGSDYVAGIVEPHVSPRISYVKTGSNLGAARNATGLIQTGSAPFVAVLNDDDRWDPDFLEQRIAFLEANPTCALVFSRCDFIDGTGSVLYRYEIDLPEGLQNEAAFLRTLYSRCVICMPTVVVRRSAYDEIGPFFKESVLFYDHEMWLRLAARFPVGFLSACDAQYRVHQSQTTQQRVRLHVGEHKLEVLDEAEKVLPPDFPQRERRRARFVALTRAGLDAFGRGEWRQGMAWLTQAFRAHPAAPFDPEIVVRVYRRLRQHAQDREFWSVGLTE